MVSSSGAGGGNSSSDAAANNAHAHDTLGLEMEPLNPTGGGGRGGGGGAAADPPAHKGRAPPSRTASFGKGGAFRGRSNGTASSSASRAGAGGGNTSSRSRGRSRLLAVLFLLLGLAVLLVMRGEEEVEMEIEAAGDFGGGNSGGGASGGGGYGVDNLQDKESRPAASSQSDEWTVQDDQPANPPPAENSAPEDKPKEDTPEENKAEETPATKEKEEKEDEKQQDKPEQPQTKEEKQKAIVEKYGEWHFWDGEPEIRPKEDYGAKYPNRDIPGDDFPETSWQVDAVYANHFLNDASNLVSRAQEAIYEEYGHGKPLPPEQMMARSKMTLLHKLDFNVENAKPPDDYLDNGGWTTERSFQGLVRRLLHSVMTNDSFTVVVIGDGPQASGVGNHFAQTYGMQFETIMAPIFARLNTKFVVHHMVREGGDGGANGPLVDGLGFADLVGQDVDLLVWDSSGLDTSKDKSYDAELDLLIRQAALGGNRIPFVLDGGGMGLEVLKVLHEDGGIDVGGLGMGWSGITETESDEQAASLPWAVRYLRCKQGKEDLCERAENKYLNTCWVDRKGVKPPKKQDEHIAGADKAHPGWRYHQLKGRMLAVTVLEALQEGVNTWSDVTITGGHPLPDEYWHVTDYYKESREKVAALDASAGSCDKLKDFLPERVCKVAMRGRTEFTPRPMPRETSISSIIKPAEGGYVPKVEEKMLYDGPDGPNPILDLPEDAFDVKFVVSAGIRRRRRQLDDAIVPGLGWQVHGELPGVCNGTATGICGRQESSSCLLAGHMDSKGGILGNEFSGWLVFTVDNVKEGLVILALETSHDPDESDRTKGWTEARTSAKQEAKEEEVKTKDDSKQEGNAKEDDNGGDNKTDEAKDDGETRRLLRTRSHSGAVESQKRRLLPDTVKFDISIDGKITTLDKKGFEERIKKPRDNLELLTVLDDASAKDGKAVEVAIRLRECGRDCAFALTHVYWA